VSAAVEKDPDAGSSGGLKDCAVVTIGTELLLGQIVDTNACYLAEALSEAGLRIRMRIAVGDEIGDIVDALRVALDRCALVITTGGLGPTLDDLTREAVAAVADVPLEFREPLMADIEAIFKHYGYHMAENNRRQAFVPQGAEAVRNPVGTAPGFICRIGEKAIACLPGVPRELKVLFPRTVLPWIRRFFRLPEQVLFYRTLKTVGIGESQVDQSIGDLIEPGGDPEIGLLASEGEIKIRIAVRAGDREGALQRIAPVEEEIRARLGRRIFGSDEETLESVIAALLTSRGLSLSILESFTSGTAACLVSRVDDFPLGEAQVIRSKASLMVWDQCREQNPGDRTLRTGPWEEADLRRFAAAFLSRSSADVALMILGCPERDAEGWQVDAHAIVADRTDLLKAFSWHMGGTCATLRSRGAVTGLNTLRLALLERTDSAAR